MSRIDEFFLEVAAARPERAFLLRASRWRERPLPPNVRYVGHVYTRDNNAFNRTPLAVLSVNRESMARYGFSPPTRVFEAAGAAACLISDAWPGIETILEPGSEVLLAGGGAAVAAHLDGLDTRRAAAIGRAAYRRVLAHHTYAHRAELLARVLEGVGSPLAQEAAT